jgi:hypothetical protein
MEKKLTVITNGNRLVGAFEPGSLARIEPYFEKVDLGLGAQAACECYAIVQARFDAFLSPPPTAVQNNIGGRR